MKAKDVFWSWDFIAALLVALALAFVLPARVNIAVTKDLYAVGISVLSIVFSVFFAALAIIISASDNDFVVFLEQEGDYTAIIQTFKVSLLALFIALIYSLLLYAMSSASVAASASHQHVAWLVLFAFLFLYGLFSAFNSALDAIRYARTRASFLSSLPRHSDRQT